MIKASSGQVLMLVFSYSHVDPPVATAIEAGLERGILDFIFSYDIACKYSIHFWERIKVALGDKPPLFSPTSSEAFESGVAAMTWLIGKFHLGGHKEECSKTYSFNYNSLVGRMSGELVETIWAAFNWLKYQTREMGPGTRIETLSDAMNHWNWLKIIKIGEHILFWLRYELLSTRLAVRSSSHIWLRYPAPIPSSHHSLPSLAPLRTTFC